MRNHVYVAFIDERLAIVRHFPHHVAQMNVSNFSLFAVLIHRVVNISLPSFPPKYRRKVPAHCSGWEPDQSAFDTCAADIPDRGCWRMVGIGGSSGCAASRTPDCSATGIDVL